MSIALMTAAWALDLPTGEKIVLLSLADNANDSGHCWPSMVTIAKRAGMTTRGAQLIVQRLEAAGHLHREQVIGKGCNYFIHPSETTVMAPERRSPRTSFAPNVDTPTPERRSPKSSGTIKQIKATPSSVRAFDEFWIAYPKHVGKQAAAKAFAIIAKRADPALIVEAARAYALHAPPDPQFIPHPTTWLKQGRYDDPIEEPSNVRSMGRNDRLPADKPGNVRTVAALDLVRQFGTAAQRNQPGDCGPDRNPRPALSAWAR